VACHEKLTVVSDRTSCWFRSRNSENAPPQIDNRRGRYRRHVSPRFGV